MTNRPKRSICEYSPALTDISAKLRTEFGIYFGPHKLEALYEKLEPLIKEEFGREVAELTPDIWSKFSSLNWNYQLAQKIICAITVPETYFFRDRAMFELIENRIVPEFSKLLRSGEKIKVWSASCCTGEEAYSLAITLREHLPTHLLTNCSIVATDICERYLETARRAQYGQFALRSTPPAIREKYFVQERNGLYELAEPIRAMVKFSCSNLLQPPMLFGDPPPKSIDLLFCRNTLIYFGDAEIDTTMSLLASRLNDRGWLFLAPAEIWKASTTLFRTEWYPGVAALRLNSEIDLDQNRPQPQVGSCSTKHVKVDHQDHMTNEPNSLTERVLDRVEKLISSGAFDDAELLLSELDEQFPPRARVLSLQSDLAAGAGRLEAALELAEKAAKESPLSPSLHFKLALIQNELGDMEATIHSLRRATFLKADYALAHYFLGTTYSKQGRQKRALVYFANVRRILASHDPDEDVADSGGITAGRLLEIIDTSSAKSPEVSENLIPASHCTDQGSTVSH